MPFDCVARYDFYRENFDTVRVLLSAQIVSDTRHTSHMFHHTSGI
jgi:hypothetical protein